MLATFKSGAFIKDSKETERNFSSGLIPEKCYLLMSNLRKSQTPQNEKDVDEREKNKHVKLEVSKKKNIESK